MQRLSVGRIQEGHWILVVEVTITNTKAKGFDIGESVTDITLLTDNNPPIFLSLKTR